MSIKEIIGKAKNGKQAWLLRPYITDAYGKRKVVNKTFYGTKREAKAEHDRLGLTKEPDAYTFQDAMDLFIHYYGKKKNSDYLADIQNSIKIATRLEPIIMNLCTAAFNNLLLDLSRTKAPRTCNKIASQICLIAKFAKKAGKIAAPPPFLDYIKIPEGAKIDKRKAPLKLKKLSDYLDPLPLPASLLIRFVLYSSCRLSPPCNLKWSDIGSEVITLTEKFGRERKILRTDRINQVLDEAAKIKLPDNDFVFQHIKNGRVGHYTKDRIQYLIKRYWHPLHRPEERKRLGVHRIRHCMAVAARQEGASQIQISKMLGHTNPASVLAYLDDNDHVAAAKTIDNVLDTLGL